jgi:hypothetical protein
VRLLLPAKRYVLLKRFTAKEERRRLVAGIVEAKDSYSPYLGLENHLNYVSRPSGELSKDEALGLATLFNSVLVDRYFRVISGNTQVNAAEIRAMPVPCVEAIREIGQAVERSPDRTCLTIEKTVGEVLSLPKTLIRELCEASAGASATTPRRYSRVSVATDMLTALNIPEMNHDKLPDVVLYDVEREWLLLIEAVTTHGPVSPKRHAELEAMLKDCPAGRVYVTAFMDFAGFKKYASEIVWESEVWIADFPDHMIHFNGDKFLGPYPPREEDDD